ncbi:TIGR02449 family protein [Marinobacterium arenosum]|uniref:TIGR02449 family protein n=1 Tax=Marinobacterium arenosum TaxID=2862496 RepID=UPI001C96CF16|nr:TIGR02449 family protein [Marinobacterium arenosum]MBY4676901.1 TIGR02449 family protein [Marinobacterium arenosum]
MTEHYFDALEQQIERLLARCQQLEQDNQHLRASEAQLREERARLLQINDQTRHKVEAMIQRLKSLEQHS